MTSRRLGMALIILVELKCGERREMDHKVQALCLSQAEKKERKNCTRL